MSCEHGRIRECLPDDRGDGWDNIFLNVTCENRERADERIPLLLELPFKHKGLHCAPLLGPLSIGRYLDSGQIEQVTCGSENYGGSRPCDFDWVRKRSFDLRGRVTLRPQGGPAAGPITARACGRAKRL